MVIFRSFPIRPSFIFAIGGQNNKVLKAARLDGTKMALVYGKDACDLQSLGNCDDGSIGQAERKIPVLRDQFSAARQVIAN